MAIALMISPACLLWGSIILAFDEPTPATIPLTYTGMSVAGVAGMAFTRDVRLFRTSQLLAILLLPFLLTASLGGFVSGSAVILWSSLCPLGAMLSVGRRQAIIWFFAFLGLLAISVALGPFARSGNNLPTAVVIAFVAMNISGVSAVAFVLLRYFIKQLEQEREKSERLLLNVLPREIATVLKEDGRTIVD